MKIAIVGKMCAGKSTLANDIKIIDNRYNIYSFGNNVKKIACEIFDMKNKDRSLLINIGKYMKLIDPDIWIKSLMNQITHEYCVIDDVRHQNELDYLIKENWFIIHLHIDNTTQIKRITKLYPNNYSDHLKNLNDISEKSDNLIYPKNYNNFLYINANDDYHKTKMTIHSLLTKHN